MERDESPLVGLLRSVHESKQQPGAEDARSQDYDAIQRALHRHEDHLRAYGRAVEELLGPPPEPPTPGDDLPGLLRGLQGALLRHPIAAQALFAGLVAEGRRFAATPPGALWRDALADSQLLRRARPMFEAVTLGVLEEHPPTLVPTRLIDALCRATDVDHLEPLLAHLFGLPEADGEPDPR